LKGAAGVATSFAAIPDANHFTAIAPLADPHSPMTPRFRDRVAR
jgi:arylformamidase